MRRVAQPALVLRVRPVARRAAMMRQKRSVGQARPSVVATRRKVPTMRT
jgi:hypothetical protein